MLAREVWFECGSSHRCFPITYSVHHAGLGATQAVPAFPGWRSSGRGRRTETSATHGGLSGQTSTGPEAVVHLPGNKAEAWKMIGKGCHGQRDPGRRGVSFSCAMGSERERVCRAECVPGVEDAGRFLSARLLSSETPAAFLVLK